MPHNAAIALYGIALDSPAEGKDVERLGFDHDVLQVDRALNPARLIRAFEMAGQVVTVLNDLEIVGSRLPVVAFGVEGPVAGHICRRLLGRWLLGDSRAANNYRQERADG